MATLICSGISIVLLFTSMIFSSMAAQDARKGKTSSAQKWSTWSAVVSGLAIAVMVIILIVHLNSSRLAKGASGLFGRAQAGLNPYIVS